MGIVHLLLVVFKQEIRTHCINKNRICYLTKFFISFQFFPNFKLISFIIFVTLIQPLIACSSLFSQQFKFNGTDTNDNCDDDVDDDKSSVLMAENCFKKISSFVDHKFFRHVCYSPFYLTIHIINLLIWLSFISQQWNGKRETK